MVMHIIDLTGVSVLFLTSGEATYSSGANIDVNGASYLRS
jgi:hypothetical protein